MSNKFMDDKFKVNNKLQSIKNHSEESKDSKTGYMDIGNSGKIASKQGTRNK